MTQDGKPKRRVVVADNDPDALELVVTDLEREGHDVVGTALDGMGALALCHDLRPDVLVVDFRMPPGSDGADIARAVHRELPETTIVVYTNYRDPAIRRKVARAGAHFLAKGNLRQLRREVTREPTP